MRIAIYIRTSTSDQHPENQLPELISYAKDRGYEYEVFEEKESTRKTRPIKQALLNRLRQGDFDGVLILKLDRWGRSISELVLEVRELFDRNVIFISKRDNIDLSTATGRLQFNILASFADFERDLIRERTLDGLARAKAEGKKLGRPRGSKDRKGRKKGGYYMRYIDTKQSYPSATAPAVVGTK